MATLVTYALTAFAISLALVPLVRLAAVRVQAVAMPSSDRWHRRATPLFGGVAIAVSTLGLALAAGPSRDLWLPLACSALIFIVGFIDDVLHLKPSTKLIAQVGIAAILLFFGYRLGWVESLTLDTMLTLVWIVGITNAFNLLDNMDGLCAGIALVVAISLLAGIVPLEGVGAKATLLAILAGSTAGFLVYNVYPASIFMGDSGSLFLGLSLATLTLGFPGDRTLRTDILSVVAVPVLVLLIPIFDTTLVTASRLMSGRRASQGGRDHSSHRLVAIGLPERTAVAVLWILAALGGGIAWATQSEGSLSPLGAALFLLGMIVFAVYLGHVRVYEEPQPALLRGNRVTPMLFRMMYKRRVAEVMLDICLVMIAYYAAYRLRYEGPQFVIYFPRFLESFPVALGVQMVTFFAVGVYRPMWRYFGLMDAVAFAKSTGLGVLSTVVVLVYVYRFEDYSRTVFVIYAALLMLLTTGSRASFRIISEFARRRRAGKRVVVYGAGDAGSLLVRELLTNAKVEYALLGFVDDDKSKYGLNVQGYPVLGPYAVLKSLIAAGAVDTVIVAAREISDERVKELSALCHEREVHLSRLQFDLQEIGMTS